MMLLGLRGGLGTPAGDIAKQLPVLLAANEYETAVGLLRGQSADMLKDISNRAIALYDVDAAVMAQLVATATTGQAPADTVPLTKAAAAMGFVMTSFSGPSSSTWKWLLGAAVVIGGGAYAFTKLRRKPAPAVG